MNRDAHGLIVHRDSRTEWLAGQLAAALEAVRPANPLEQQTVVVAHPGLRRWLLGEFARRPGIRGSHGIAANFDMILPWQWLERVAEQVLGDAALIGGPYRRELLRWRIFAALPGLNAPQIDSYLAGSESERRRFRLAEHLAGVFEQYLIYRPDWILDWERDPRSGDWQAALWRKVQSAIGQPHRAQRGEALLVALADSGDGEHLPLHVFGVSHLPPDILAALNALATQRPVHLYFPDPCREYWADLKSHRALLRMEDDADALYYEVRHPLLVSLGRIAQDFCLALDELDVQSGPDPDFAEVDVADPAVSNSLLASMQASIRGAEPGLVGAVFRADMENAATSNVFEQRLLGMREDASLRVHACHTRLRELEVLKDALLRVLADDPTLAHRDIVVMTPLVAAYAPYLRAVFGEAARYGNDPAHIPWHLADVALAHSHPLLSAFVRMLDLAESRFAVSDVLGLLDVPAVARRFDIDERAREALEQCLRRAHVAWGLDAEMKAQAGAAAVEANSWKFGFDRLYAGLIAGDDGALPLLDGVLPLQGMSGDMAQAVGQLGHLLDELRRTCDGFALMRPLAAWNDWLLDRIDALFDVDVRDADEVTALDKLRRTVAKLAEQADAAGRKTALPWSVVHEAMRLALDDESERQPFLLGGVTFCGMVPQRSIPFRVVCLLGMNEVEFPRANTDGGLNQMAAKPKRGDRDTRSEDRYLFLEALMSARERLHISYVGEGVRDGKPRNPASPLAELLQFLDEQHRLVGEPDLPRPWLLRHPLQPFDPRYYRQDNDRADDGTPRHDPRLFSYAAGLADLPLPTAAQARKFLSLGDGPVPAPAPAPELELGKEVSLATLRRFWRDPATTILRDGMGLSLDALDDDSWPDREPLDAKVDRRERIDRRLLFDALAAGVAVIPPVPPSWLALSGVLAAGAAGELAYAQARDRAAAVLATANEILGAKPIRCAQAIDLDIGDGLRLGGTIDRVFRLDNGSLCLFDAKPSGLAGFSELVAFYIDLAALRLHSDQVIAADFVEYEAGAASPACRPDLLMTIRAQGPDELRTGLRRLVDMVRAASRRPLLFPPKTAWAWAIANVEQRQKSARAEWEGGFNRKGEHDYSPGYNGLLTRDLDMFVHGSAAHEDFKAAVELVAGVLDPQRQVLLRDVARPKRAARSGKP